MIGLDTNVIVRFLTQDDPEQTAIAVHVMEQLTADRPGFVSLVVLVEVHWVLRRGFKLGRDAAVNVLGQLATSEEIIIQDSEIVHRALKHAQGQIDFPDALVVELARKAGCDYTVTFDQRAAGLQGMKLLLST